MAVTDQPAPVREEPLIKRTAEMVVIGALAVCLVGYFVGMRQAENAQPKPSNGADRTPVIVEGLQPASSYDELGQNQRWTNAGWTNHLNKLSETPDEPPPAPTPELRRLALAHREGRRAYMGAPPVIPHTVEQRSAASCLICHETGKRIGERVASPMPHEAYTNCTQCHAPPAPNALGSAPRVANGFRGLRSPERGERAWIGAPPVIPHPTAQRNRCLSCHGPRGEAGLRTTHPWRVSCNQCHASSTGFSR